MSNTWSRNIVLALCVAAVALLATNLVVILPSYWALTRLQKQVCLGSGDLSTTEISSRKAGSSYVEATLAEEGRMTLTVSGSGTATSKPEVVIISIGVVTRGETASEAQSLNAEKMSKVINALKEIGVKEDQIETISYSLRPVYEYNKVRGRSVLVGYECTNNIKVTLEELDKAGEVVDAAVSAGANKVLYITFSLKPETREKLMLEALAKAVGNAKAKAEAIAKAAGITLVGPVNISIGGIWMPTTRYEATGDLTIKTPIIAPEELSVTVTVTITYEFR